ncbi:MAG: cation diffusion facilitator family transporter [ANME-2 cluster archaeon]|nr:cation diffusion facilitator family transporter [ANME-2 cluster archaeon]MDF1557938.1 cation diffusion facilitator family transporter [ANME-2 cluster archaeon]
MSRHDDHDHVPNKTERNLRYAIYATFSIFILEVAGGLYTNSLALLSDAAHMFMDMFALVLTYAAIQIAKRPSNHNVTYGYHRLEIFSALINGFTLIIISVFITREAYFRLLEPPEVRGMEMLVVAAVGLLVNLWVTTRLHGHHDLNVRGAYLHALGDTLSSVAVIAGALIILFTGSSIVDPVLSFVIVAVILFGSVRLITDSLHILMESAPRHIDINELVGAVNSIEGVQDIHDIHLWSVCSNVHALSAHVLVDDMQVCETAALIDTINKVLAEKFIITQTTFQFESIECGRLLIHGIEH